MESHKTPLPCVHILLLSKWTHFQYQDSNFRNLGEKKCIKVVFKCKQSPQVDLVKSTIWVEKKRKLCISINIGFAASQPHSTPPLKPIK